MIFILVIAKFYCNFLKFPLKVFFDMAIVLFKCKHVYFVLARNSVANV